VDQWIIWIITGSVLVVAELLLPGGIAIFVGVSALIVGTGIKFGYLNSVVSISLSFFIISILLLFFVRGLFLKYFEGDSRIQNVNEEKDFQGSIVEVAENIFPYREGRVHFRGVTWQARSEEELLEGTKAIITKVEGNILIVKSL